MLLKITPTRPRLSAEKKLPKFPWCKFCNWRTYCVCNWQFLYIKVSFDYEEIFVGVCSNMEHCTAPWAWTSYQTKKTMTNNLIVLVTLIISIVALNWYGWHPSIQIVMTNRWYMRDAPMPRSSFILNRAVQIFNRWFQKQFQQLNHFISAFDFSIIYIFLVSSELPCHTVQ